jgi:hypothetical protein
MLRHVLAAVAAVLMLGAVVLALAPFEHRLMRCGAPLLGAESAVDQLPADAIAVPGCGDEGVRRLVYAAGVFVVGSTVAVVVALREVRELRGGSRPVQPTTGSP